MRIQTDDYGMKYLWSEAKSALDYNNDNESLVQIMLHFNPTTFLSSVF